MTHSNSDGERRVALRVPGELAAKVEKVAAQEDRSVSATIRTAMREYVASREEVSGRAA